MSKKVLLYSGGMDSWLVDKLIKPDSKIYIDDGSEYSKEEISRVRDTDTRIVSLPLSKYEQSEDHLVPFRNLYFIMIAATENYGDLDIYLSATAGDEHAGDKSPEFARMAGKLLTYIARNESKNADKNRTINVILPFADKTKAEILSKYLRRGGNIQLAFENSFSCYKPVNGEPCWNCQPCFRKAVAFTVNGYKFENGEEKLLLDFFETKIKPDWNSWRKIHQKEVNEVQQAVAIWKGEQHAEKR